MPRPPKTQISPYETRRKRRDRTLSFVQMMVWTLTGGLVLLASFELIEPDAGGFAANLKRVLATLAITFGGYSVSRLAIVRGAPLAAQGSVLAGAASALTFAVLTPTIVVLSFLALSAPEVRKTDALEKCQLIRQAASQLDEVVLARTALEKSIKAIGVDLQARAHGEATRGRESGKKSVPGRPQPVTTLYEDARRYAGLAEDQLARGGAERIAAVRDLASVADDCERLISDPKKWRKEGSAAVGAIYDRAGGRLRELAQAAPLSGVRSLSDQLRTLASSDTIDKGAIEDARRVVRGHSDRLDRELANLPRMPDALPPMAASPVLVAAFEPSKFAGTWHNLLIALLVEGGSPLLWMYAFVHAQRQNRDDDLDDDGDDDDVGPPNGRAVP